MDANKEPGILFNNVMLQKCNFELRAVKDGSLKKNMKIDFKINNRFSENKEKLFTDLGISIGKEDAEMPFLLEVVMTGIFSVDEKNINLNLETFSKNNAPAIIFPYLREFVTNITSRANFKPPIILPPMNIVKMMTERKFDETKKEHVEN